jgi:hypothetical protein
MTACASLIPIKANAATVTFLPLGGLKTTPNSSIVFILELNPASLANPGQVKSVTLLDIFDVIYDKKELSLISEWKVPDGTIVDKTTTIASYVFNVLKPVKDGESDVSTVVYYQDGLISTYDFTLKNFKNDVEPVPEPLTILGAVAALGYGALLKRQSVKNKKS